MKGMILAAGLGTRLKPWTDFHPKALYPVEGIPMLQRVVESMYHSGIDNITVNVFHFAEQIEDFIREKGWKLQISDERPMLLETGGGLLKAAPLLNGDEPILVHNADILSNADFNPLEKFHLSRDADVTLLVSHRDSSRKLIFDDNMRLKGWHSLRTGEYKPSNFIGKPYDTQLAFSGIYMISPRVFKVMTQVGRTGKFPIMDFLLDSISDLKILGYLQNDLWVKDIGKA